MYKYLLGVEVFLAIILSGKGESHNTECPENMLYQDCTPNCPPTCEFKSLQCHIFKFICAKGCVCRTGYILKSDSDKTCVKLEDCSKSCSKPNFEWKDCGTSCPKTCTDLKISKGPCVADYCVSGCFCKQPYILDDVNRRCVLEEDCP